jgi:alpha-galactosidase
VFAPGFLLASCVEWRQAKNDRPDPYDTTRDAMPIELSNRWLHWSIDPNTGAWSLSPLTADGPAIHQASMGVSYTVGLAGDAWTSLLQGAQADSLPESTIIGRAVDGVRYKCADPRRPLRVQIDVAMLREQPVLLMRMRLENTGSRAMRLGRLGFLSAGRANPRRASHAWEPGGSEAKGSGLLLAGEPDQARFLAQGWQSWSYSGSLGLHDRQPQTRLSLLTRPIFNNPETGRPRSPGHFVSDMFGAVLEPAEGSGLLAGFVSQRQAFGSVETYLPEPMPGFRLWAQGDGLLLKPGETFETDWACLTWLSLDESSPLGPYIDLAADAGRARTGGEVPTGWSSWYCFFESVDQVAMTRNLQWLQHRRGALPWKVFQLDDGFEANVGNWYQFDDGFGGGLEPIGEQIASAEYTPGLWLAPYIAKPRSAWIREHPEWVLRRGGGRPSNAGYNWSTFTVGLDPTHPGVEAAVGELIETAVKRWGFSYLKLDFLYAAALPGRRYDPATTRAQAMHRALATIRQAAGEDVWLLGCGCPVGSGIGLFDSMRIGPDVAPRWKPAYQGIELYFQREPGLPSARNALLATVNRAMFNRKWWLNDPDCLIVRDRDSHLTRAEVQTLVSVMALSGGALIDSDDLPNLSPERAAWLPKLLPPLPPGIQIHHLFDLSAPEMASMELAGPIGEWQLICLVNWEDSPRDMRILPEEIGLDAGSRFSGVDFWREQPVEMDGSPLTLNVPSHGVRLLSLRLRDDSTPLWLGDTLHISQGLAVKAWETTGDSLHARLNAGRAAEGRIWLALPGEPSDAALNGLPVALQPIGEGIYAANISFDMEAELNVRWA